MTILQTAYYHIINLVYKALSCSLCNSRAADMTKIYSQLSADNAASAAAETLPADLNAMRLKQRRSRRTMSECAGVHYANINFAGSNNNPILGKGEMEKTYYTGN